MKQLEPGQYEKIAEGIYLEGLAVDHARDIIWYSDVITGGIHGVKPDGTKVTTLNPTRQWTGGVMVNDDGAVLSSGEGGIMWNNPETGRSGWLIHEIDGKVINGINEMMPDGTGGIYFGTNDIEYIIQGKETRPSTLYRLTQDFKLIMLVDGIGFTNGIMLSPDGKHFYCNDTFRRSWVFDVTSDHRLVNQRPFLEKEDADGMALDAEGNVWITGFKTSDIERVRPDGTKLPPLKTLTGANTQIRFGGADARDIYLNGIPGNAGETLKEGGSLSGNHSFLFRGRSEVPGMKIPPSRFKLT